MSENRPPYLFIYAYNLKNTVLSKDEANSFTAEVRQIIGL
jgi:hypothetical protein